jgi:hypothetical protein
MRITVVLSFLVIPLVSCFDALHGTSPLDSSLGFTRLLNPLKSRHAGGHSHAHRLAGKSLQARATLLPLGWTSKGCFSDRHVMWCPFIFMLISCSVSERTLASYMTTSNLNTPNACIVTCQGKGYSYAGVEYGWALVLT